MTTPLLFTPVECEGRVLGHAARTKAHLFFFGQVDADLNDLERCFPEYTFARVHQVHGTDVVPSDEFGGDRRADAHFTDRPHLAPVIVTADCVPVLLASPTRVCAVHAGWRGVAAGVINRAIAAFTEPIERVAIGPHLGVDSFEIGRDVAAQLDAARPIRAEFTRPHSDPKKVRYDLTALARAQIEIAAGRHAVITAFCPDTLTTLSYHSYRRDGGRAGRNLSFVVRLS